MEDTGKRGGCGCFAGAIGGGCGCLAVIIILLIGGSAGSWYWFQSHIERDPAAIVNTASEIVEEPIPGVYVPRFGFNASLLRFSVFIVDDLPSVRAMAYLADTPINGVTNYDLKSMFEAYYTILPQTNLPRIIVRVVEPDGTVKGPPPAEPPEDAETGQQGTYIVSLYQMILPRGDRTILAYYFLRGDVELTGEGRAFFRMVAE